MKTTKQQYHYFASSVFSWVTDDDLFACLRKIKSYDSGNGAKHCMVWKVPVPSDQHYAIEWFSPQVEGAELIDEMCFYTDSARKKFLKDEAARDAKAKARFEEDA